MGAVPHVGSHARGEGPAARLLPRQPGRAPNRRGCVYLGGRGDQAPSGRVVAPRQEVQFHTGARGETRSQRHGVHPGADGTRGNRGNIEEDPHESQSTSAQRRWARSETARAYAAA